MNDYATRIARSHRAQQRRRLKAYGQWQPFVDVTPVREHVKVLRENGMTLRRICELSETTWAVMSRIAYTTGQQEPQKRIRPQIAARILAVQPTWSNVSDENFMPSTAAVRRLQALVAVGWPAPYLAAELGIHATYLNVLLRGEKDKVAGRTNRLAAELYSRLWNVDPISRGVDCHAKKRAQSRAQSWGWALPAAWDDDHIGDPEAQPDSGEHTPRYIALAEDCAELERLGQTREQIAARLGVTRDGLQRALSIYRQKTAAAA